MSDDHAREAEVLKRRIAYIDHLRSLHRFERNLGLGVILLSAAIVMTAQFMPLPKLLVLTGFSLLAAGWVISIYVIWKRTVWRRANPFETWKP
jgi:hypothetical protein